MPKKIEPNIENPSFWSRMAILLAPADEAILHAGRNLSRTKPTPQTINSDPAPAGPLPHRC